MCNCLHMMMAHLHPCYLIYMWLLQNFAEGSSFCHSCRYLGSNDMFILIMLEGKHCTYEGASLARTYNSLGEIDEETTMNLKRVWTTTMFNCLFMAMDSSYIIIDILNNKELKTNRLSPSSIGKWIIIKH